MAHSAGRMLGEGAQMHFVNHQVGRRYFQRLVASPVIVLPNDLSAVLEGVGRVRLDTPNGPARDGACKWIQQHAAPIKAQSLFRVIGAVKPIPIFGGFDIESIHHHGIYISNPESIGKRNLLEGCLLAVMVQNQRTGRRLF